MPFLFSPNFVLQFDFNFSEQYFFIRDAKSQFIYYYLPKDFINTIWNKMAEQNSVKIIASRFKWVTDKVFCIINRSNLNCLFEICTNDPYDTDID